jgi:hypothetical protein
LLILNTILLLQG